MSSKLREMLASVIGWVIVALIVIWLFGFVVGWITFVLRSMIWIVLIGVLLAIYFTVKGGPPDA